MASRLANTVQAGLTKQFVRPLATAAKQSVTSRVTHLPNGLTVATDENGASGAATVGVWIDAGSRNEKTNGTAHFLEHVLLSKQGAKMEKIGGELKSLTSREHSVYATKTLGANVSDAVDLLAELVQNVNLAGVESSRGAVVKQQEAAQKDGRSVVFDHLYATAFQGETLGRPVEGIASSVESLSSDEIEAFHRQHYRADRMVLVGSGQVEHEALVRLAEKRFGSLEGGAKTVESKPLFTGSEVRLRDDVLPVARVALAVEGAPYLSEDYFSLLVMQHIVGAWSKDLSGAAHLSSRLSTIVNEHHLANAFAAFNLGHKDTGLWGMYVETANKLQIDDFVHFLQKEWTRLSTSVTDSEVERAKQQLKSSLALQLDSTCAVAHDIGTQVLATGKYLSPADLDAQLRTITAGHIRKAAYKYLWDQEIAVVGHGPIEGLTDYTRVRGNMAYNRF
ncbi:Metalloenzyme, LuxS/M16 peptidase-like protein [Sporodiniella umbellata]|nr:Metalloenzyme, LuxS/M16 peptidase-like protein [Sporodiniella umbellata]